MVGDVAASGCSGVATDRGLPGEEAGACQGSAPSSHRRGGGKDEARLWGALGLPMLYGVLVHYGVLSGRFAPALALLLAFLAWGALGRLRSGRGFWSILPFLLATLFIFGALRADAVLSLFFVPPLVVPLGLAVLFGLTLLPGATPLVTQVSRVMKGELDAKALRYTRGVTQAWTLFFLALALESVLLAYFAAPATWSLFANGLNYLFLAAFFVIEYLIRRRLFREVTHPPFLTFLHGLLAFDYSCLRLR